ncbi:prepilin-type N-terminal cleavage/methylation domain-containing protein [Actinotalea sp. AC32]|nr:prepilin-type N-terminal cleavage/methylation domain-containing protein [Actinotalea sp. AC32]
MIRRMHGRRDDEGFGLIEAVVAMLIAGVVFAALAASLVSAVKASLYSRQNQQATDFMTRELETLRASGFGALAHTVGTVAGDPRLNSCGGTYCLDVNGVDEPVVTVASGGLPSVTTVVSGAESNSTTFTVSRYVTAVPGESTDTVRRATVVITWDNGGVERTRSTSSLIAFTQRGLPLPNFRLELPSPSIAVNPGGVLDFTLTVTNQGAPDRWNLTHNGPMGWAFYTDTDDDGDFDPAVDQPLADSNGDGQPDTGRLDPATTFRFFLARTTSSTEGASTTSIVVTARSVGQPAATGGTKSVTGTATVTTSVIVPTTPPTTPTTPPGPTPAPEVTCPAVSVAPAPSGTGGYSVRQYTLQHEGVGSSPTQTQMYLGTSAGDELYLSPYSTDQDAAATGRVLQPVASLAATSSALLATSDKSQYADWAVQLNKKSTIDGQATARFWVARHGAGSAVDLKVILYTAASNGTGLTRTERATASVSLGTLSCAGFQEVSVQLPGVSAVNVPKNGWFGVRVVAGGAPVRIAYDVPSQFPSTFVMRVK